MAELKGFMTSIKKREYEFNIKGKSDETFSKDLIDIKYQTNKKTLMAHGIPAMVPSL